MSAPYPAHPYAELFPLDEETLPALVEALVIHGGNLDPIVLLDGMVLDGRRRQLGCIQAKLQPRYIAYSVEAHGDPLEYVISKNCHGRRLTEDQKIPALSLFLERHLDWSDGRIANALNVGRSCVRRRRALLAEQGQKAPNELRLSSDNRVVSSAPKPKRSRRSSSSKTAPKPPPDAGDAWEGPANAAEAETDKRLLEAAGAPRDDTGSLVPDHLADAFRDDFYPAFADQIERAVAHVKGNRKVYTRLFVKGDGLFFTLATDLLESLRRHAPARVCPKCQGREQGCEVCYHTGWLSQGQVEEFAQDW